MGKRNLKIEIVDSADGPRVRFVAGNGKIIATTEAYQSGKPGRAVESIVTAISDGNYEIIDTRQ